MKNEIVCQRREVEEEDDTKKEKLNLSKVPIADWKKGSPMKKGTFYRSNKSVVFRYIENKLYRGIVKVGEVEQELKEQIFSINLPLIPYDLIDKIHSFFQEVYDTYDTESVILLWFNFDTKTWEIEIPKQTVSGASVQYNRKDKEIQELEAKGFTLVGSVHSHCQMSAFHSGVDDDDEFNFDGLHVTIGRVNTGPDFACRFIMKEVFATLEPEKCIEMREIKLRHPKSWMDNVSDEPVLISGFPNGFIDNPNIVNQKSFYD